MAKGFVRHIDDFKDVGEGYVIRDPEGEVCESNIVTVKKGESTAPGCHNNEEEYYFVYSGAADVTLNGKNYIVKKNDFIFIPRNCEHSVKCISDEDFIYLCVAIYLDRKPVE